MAQVSATNSTVIKNGTVTMVAAKDTKGMPIIGASVTQGDASTTTASKSMHFLKRLHMCGRGIESFLGICGMTWLALGWLIMCVIAFAVRQGPMRWS